jgi:hypothetical protein
MRAPVNLGPMYRSGAKPPRLRSGPADRSHPACYAVGYRGRPLALPKALLGTAADIDRSFIAAGFPPDTTDNDSVLLGCTPATWLPGGSTRSGTLTFVYARAAGKAVQIYDQQRQWLGAIADDDGRWAGMRDDGEREHRLRTTGQAWRPRPKSLACTSYTFQ